LVGGSVGQTREVERAALLRRLRPGEIGLVVSAFLREADSIFKRSFIRNRRLSSVADLAGQRRNPQARGSLHRMTNAVLERTAAWRQIEVGSLFPWYATVEGRVL